jgi:two-component system sensor histidine kinase/response regulator
MTEKKSKILIVDDAIDTVELLRKRFHSEGYDTAEAYDGEEALKRVDEYSPDLIVLDVMMPKIDGYEVCRRLKTDENKKYVPILMLTAKGGIESKVKGLEIGADDYLAKPFDYKELSARVKSLLTIKASREKLVEEEKSVAMEKMMDEVAHEVRNPLVSIGGFAKRVYDRLPENDPNKKYLEMIMDEVSKLENMVKLLIELKTMAVCYSECADVNDIIIEVLSIHEEELADKGIAVKTELMDSPPCISGDKEQLKAAISNLVKNSIEAMLQSPKMLRITTSAGDGRMVIEVSDTGKGIPKDKLKNIFHPFYTSKIYGPGLGLTFTLKIIQQHGGSISVESEPGKGTMFTIRLPIRKT